MKLKLIALALATSGVLAGCQTVPVDQLLGVGAKALQVATLSDQNVVALSQQSCQQMDQQNAVAPSSSAQYQRLQRLAQPLAQSLNGQTPNFRVYQSKDLNAWAMANGCIRFYAGLMELMDDDELRGIIAHEMGHVALGHSKRAMQAAYAIAIGREALAAAGGQTLAALSQSQLGDLTETLLNAQFSQAQETAADDYAFSLLSSRALNTRGLVSAFQKLAQIDGGQGSIMSTHPGSSARAARMQQKIEAGR